MTAPAITAGLDFVLLALTATERWEAAKNVRTSSSMPVYVIAAVFVAILVGVVLLVVLSSRPQKKSRRMVLFSKPHKKSRKNKQKTTDSFYNLTMERGLSWREYQILRHIATNLALERKESILILSNTFDRGAAKMVEECLALEGAEKSKFLRCELAELRQTLGFDIQHPASIGTTTKSNKLSSRQIPDGAKLHMIKRKSHDSNPIKSTIINNSDKGLTLELETPCNIVPGEKWCLRYYLGPSIWEFDASVVDSNGTVVVLNHSDHIWFINRRRFLRVPTKKPAFIAPLPSERPSASNGQAADETEKYRFVKTEDGLKDVSEHLPGLPELTPAIITELGGPGLRLDVSLDVKTGEKVFVAFRLDEERQDNSTPDKADDVPVSNAPVSRVIKGTGVVRHIRPAENGLSIAVEMVGLNKLDINRLIRATNIAAMRDNADENADSENHTTHQPAEPVGQKAAGLDK